VNGIKQHKSIGVDENNDPINSYVITESGDISFSDPDFVGTDEIEVFAIVSAGVPFVPSDGSIRKNHLADELKMLTEDALGGDGGTDFPLSYAPGSASSILVFVDGVHQKAIAEYTIVNGTTLRFVNAPAIDNNNIQNIRVIHLTYSVGVAEIIPLDDTVTTSKIRNDAVTTPKILDDAVTTPKILDNSVTIDKLGFTIEDPFIAGTKMVFYQASAPTGWTQDTANNDKALRVVSGTGGGTGGTNDFSSAHTHSHTGTGGNHTLTQAQMPSHRHVSLRGGNAGSTATGWTTVSSSLGPNGFGGGTDDDDWGSSYTTYIGGNSSDGSQSQGSTSSHSHSVTVDSETISAYKYIDVIVCSKD
jgi:hypothetical protein